MTNSSICKPVYRFLVYQEITVLSCKFRRVSSTLSSHAQVQYHILSALLVTDFVASKDKSVNDLERMCNKAGVVQDNHAICQQGQTKDWKPCQNIWFFQSRYEIRMFLMLHKLRTLVLQTQVYFQQLHIAYSPCKYMLREQI